MCEYYDTHSEWNDSPNALHGRDIINLASLISEYDFVDNEIEVYDLCDEYDDDDNLVYYVKIQVYDAQGSLVKIFRRKSDNTVWEVSEM